MTQFSNRAIRWTGVLLFACSLGWTTNALAAEDDTMAHDNGAMSHDSEMNHDPAMSDNNMAANPGADGPQGDSTYQNQLDPAHDKSHDDMSHDTDMEADEMHHQSDDNDM